MSGSSYPYVIIEVAWPVDDKGRIRATGKGRPKFSSHGGFVRAYTPAKTRAFENTIKEAGIAAMSVMGLEPLDEAVTVRIRAYMPVPASWSEKKRASALAGDIAPIGKPDMDNIEKLLDGLNYHPPRFKGDKEKRPIVWRDDSQIIGGDFLKTYDARPRLHIAVFRWF